jgi:hypothetical protein
MSSSWTMPDGSRIYVPDSATLTSKPPTPAAVRQFLREIGRRGGLQRSRNFARRDPRGWMRFLQRYRSHPNRVTAAPVTASSEVWHCLRAYANLGGQKRARRYPSAMRRAWAAKGGYAKAAKFRKASTGTQGVAGKQRSQNDG